MTIEYPEELLNLADFKKYSDTFIETGTCVGDGVQRAIDAKFQKIKSVEIHSPYHTQAMDRFQNVAGFIERSVYCTILHTGSGNFIQLYLGDTIKCLPKMLAGLLDPVVIFLDAHPSGPGTAGHDDLMQKGEDSEFHQDNIIAKELDIIFNQHSYENIIMIDDMNGANPSSHKHMARILKYNPEYKFHFYDQKLGDTVYPDKVLVCIP